VFKVYKFQICLFTPPLCDFQFSLSKCLHVHHYLLRITLPSCLPLVKHADDGNPNVIITSSIRLCPHRPLVFVACPPIFPLSSCVLRKVSEDSGLRLVGYKWGSCVGHEWSLGLELIGHKWEGTSSIPCHSSVPGTVNAKGAV
jgi:hypothetical protein